MRVLRLTAVVLLFGALVHASDEAITSTEKTAQGARDRFDFPGPEAQCAALLARFGRETLIVVPPSFLTAIDSELTGLSNRPFTTYQWEWVDGEKIPFRDVKFLVNLTPASLGYNFYSRENTVGTYLNSDDDAIMISFLRGQQKQHHAHLTRVRKFCEMGTLSDGEGYATFSRAQFAAVVTQLRANLKNPNGISIQEAARFFVNARKRNAKPGSTWLPFVMPVVIGAGGLTASALSGHAHILGGAIGLAILSYFVGAIEFSDPAFVWQMNEGYELVEQLDLIASGRIKHGYLSIPASGKRLDIVVSDDKVEILIWPG